MVSQVVEKASADQFTRHVLTNHLDEPFQSVLQGFPLNWKSRNFSGHFRMPQFLLYLKNGVDLSRQTSQT